MNCPSCECPISSSVGPKRKPLQPTKDVSSLDYYQIGKIVQVPFNLYWSPKPIVGPYNVSTKKYGLREVTKNTTKLDTIVSPCCHLAAVRDPNIYSTIVTDMYMTNKKRADYDIETQIRPRLRNTPGFDDNERKLSVTGNIYKPIEKKYIDASKEWDNQNVRCGCDPDCSFWKRFCAEEKKTLPNPRHVVNLITPETKEKIQGLLKDGKMSVHHSKYPLGYDGHIVQNPVGVPLVKHVYPMEHVLKSTYNNDFKNF